MNNKGQSVLAEHVMIFFVVIAALVTMTTFIQRGFEARIHDARNFMIASVMPNSVCDANCLAATGNEISYEYEPYYLQVFSDVSHHENKYQGDTSGNSEGIGAKYYKSSRENTSTFASSPQKPPECARADPPTYCNDL